MVLHGCSAVAAIISVWYSEYSVYSIVSTEGIVSIVYRGYSEYRYSVQYLP
jgi:acetyl-CoA carboxylase alpha subunit